MNKIDYDLQLKTIIGYDGTYKKSKGDPSRQVRQNLIELMEGTKKRIIRS